MTPYEAKIVDPWSPGVSGARVMVLVRDLTGRRSVVQWLEDFGKFPKGAKVQVETRFLRRKR